MWQQSIILRKYYLNRGKKLKEHQVYINTHLDEDDSNYKRWSLVSNCSPFKHFRQGQRHAARKTQSNGIRHALLGRSVWNKHAKESCLRYPLSHTEASMRNHDSWSWYLAGGASASLPQLIASILFVLLEEEKSFLKKSVLYMYISVHVNGFMRRAIRPICAAAICVWKGMKIKNVLLIYRNSKWLTDWIVVIMFYFKSEIK